MGSSVGMPLPSAAAKPRGLQGLGAHCCVERAVSLDNPTGKFLLIQRWLRTTLTQWTTRTSMMLIREVTQPLGQRERPSSHPFTRSHPVPAINHPSPPGTFLEAPLILWFFLKVRSTLPGVWAFFSPIKKPRMTLENFWLPGYCYWSTKEGKSG